MEKKCESCKYYNKGNCSDMDLPCIMIKYNCEDCGGYEAMDEVEKKEINEMANICEAYKNRWSNNPQGFCYEQAKALVNADYGKVKDYKEEIARLKEENEKLFESNKALLNGLKEAENIAKDFVSEDNQLKIANEIADMIKEERKQAIKEFAEQLIHKQTIKCVNYTTEDEINSLLKECGIRE